MTDQIERPLLRFRPHKPDTLAPSAKPHGRTLSREKRDARSKALAPKFEALVGAMDARRIVLRQQAPQARPEHVVVFELDRCNLTKLFDVARAGRLEWLLDEERFGDEADGDDDEAATARLCLLFSSQDAVDDLLLAWRSWGRGRLPTGLGHWAEVFEVLRDVRRWGRDDRLREYEMEVRWKDLVVEGRTAPFEIELWFRKDLAAREAAERRVREAVEALGGRVLDRTLIEGIAYHVVLAEVNASLVERLLSADVALVQLDDVHRFRPMTGPAIAPADDEPALVAVGEPSPPSGTLLPPYVALLDGLPMQNHAALAGRLRVLDVHDLEPLYVASHRKHGTAMASLITRGDLALKEPASSHELVVVPVIAPSASAGGEERAPEGRLWLDVIRRAIVEVLKLAPTVRVFNLSLGDGDAALRDGISPLARMLDWLAWEHRVLFIVSAGNWMDDFDVPPSLDIERDVVRVIWRSRAERRVIPPAEGVQVLTVGAAPIDATERHDSRRDPECVSLLEGDVLPAPYSRNGPGFLRSVKPDVFLPGGRAKYWRGLLGNGRFTHMKRASPPGQLVASPRASDARSWGCGTSNATALASRAAERVLAQVSRMAERAPAEHSLPRGGEALLTRALLIHGARWVDDGKRVLKHLRGEDAVTPTTLTELLGFGVTDVDRVIEGTKGRATLFDVHKIRPGEAEQYDVPLPDCLRSTVEPRRVVVTVVWFTPIHPRHRRYRCVGLNVSTNLEDSPLRVLKRGAVAGSGRGTVFHRVFDRDKGAIDLGAQDRCSVVIRASRQAPNADPELAVPYAIVITIETDASVPLYDQVEAWVENELRARVRSTS